MATRAGYNKNSSAIKRIMQEARELANDPCTDYTAAPLEDDIFEWHCTIRGAPGTEFEGGLYHFRILLPSEYPFRPPSIMMLTPNGRFELNTKICISFTNYHEELWQPAWGVRTAIIGLQGFFPLKGTAAVGVGALEYPSGERKRLAALSREWVCSRCSRTNLESLPDPETPADTSSDGAEGNYSSTVPPLSEVTLTDQSTLHTHLSDPGPAPVTMEVTPSPSLQVFAPTPTRPLLQAPIVHSRASSAPISRSESVSTTRSEESVINLAPPHIALDRPLPKSPRRPPIVLDTVICILLVLLFALICRRVL